MPWLERLNDRQTRRLATDLRHSAVQTRDLAQEHFAGFARDAGRIANRTAHQVADYGRHEGADFARDTARHYAERAGELAGQVANYGRHEGAILAQAAATQALRVGRAAKADPVPVIVGAVGLALLASLLLGRRT